MTFRDFLFDHDHPRLARVRGLGAYDYREHAREDDFTGGLVRGWTPLYDQDLVGITEDGTLRTGLHRLEPARDDERAPVEAMVVAAEHLLAAVTPGDRDRLTYAVDAVEWQRWANPEFLQHDTGLRLEHQPPEVVDAALALVAASLSPEGDELVRRMRQLNGFLGEVVDLPTVLNELSYQVALFGTPDPVAPWGWQLFGHHVALSCLVVEGRMALGPVFLGAEPDVIDAGPHARPGEAPPYARRIALATDLMAALPDEQVAAAVAYEQMVDPAMPPGRVHPGDERHLGGAFQDNRVIPFEGAPVRGMPPAARQLVVDLVAEWLTLLPAGPRAARLREVVGHLDDTWVSWIGGHRRGDVFYVRVQSPVVLVELDHHCGVFLDHATPQPFHIHTVMRTPHGNDYGRAWVRAWQEQHP